MLDYRLLQALAAVTAVTEVTAVVAFAVRIGVVRAVETTTSA